MNNYHILCDKFTMLCIFRTQNKLYELSPFLSPQKHTLTKTFNIFN
jgi:hypothetical protein